MPIPEGQNPTFASARPRVPEKIDDARKRLIVALDVPNAAAATELVNRLEGTCQWFKVGLELFTAAGPPVVERLVARGCSVFLDLKLHDIPNTVAGAVRSAAALGVRMITVHAGGGPAMLASGASALDGVANPPQLLAVTVLTSMDEAQLRAAEWNAHPPNRWVCWPRWDWRRGFAALSARRERLRRCAPSPAPKACWWFPAFVRRALNQPTRSALLRLRKRCAQGRVTSLWAGRSRMRPTRRRRPRCNFEGNGRSALRALSNGKTCS